MRLDGLEPQPAGFPDCAVCVYRTTGTPAICFACANAGTVPVADEACPVCGQGLVDGGSCTNTVCSFDDRYFSGIYTVSRHADEMWNAVSRFKYDEDRGWAEVLGRILVGFLG